MATLSETSSDVETAAADAPTEATAAASAAAAPKRAARRSSTTAPRKAARRAGTSRKAASTTTSTQPKTAVGQVSDLASRAILVPASRALHVQVGASLIVRDDIVSTVTDLAGRYRTRAAGIERELARYEKRGAEARNRFEKQVLRQRTRLERQSKSVSGKFEKVISSAHGFIS